MYIFASYRCKCISATKPNDMVKYILSLFLLTAFVATMPLKASASRMAEIELIDNNDFNKVVITLNGSNLRVTGAEGMMLCIYNIAGGQPVMKAKVESADKTYDLALPKGVYIVQVGNKATRKIVIK